MTEQSMIERVARAICVGDPDARQPTTKIVWAPDMQSAQGTMDYADCRPAWTFEVDKARKAIEAMLNPTKEMTEACYAIPVWKENSVAEMIVLDAARIFYGAMVESALK